MDLVLLILVGLSLIRLDMTKQEYNPIINVEMQKTLYRAKE